MGDIHDALDKAIQTAENELEKDKAPLKNVFKDQVIADKESTDASPISREDALDKAIANAEHAKAKNSGATAQATVGQGIQSAINTDLMRQKRIVSLNTYSAESEAFRMLRTKILKRLRENGWNSFAITAPAQGAGKTMVAVNLAIAMAMDVNQSILLVDLDLRHPKVHWYFGLETEAGIHDYFTSKKSLKDILVNPGLDRLTLLPGKNQDQAIGTSEILSGPRMRDLINEINVRNQSRIIIFACPRCWQRMMCFPLSTTTTPYCLWLRKAKPSRKR